MARNGRTKDINKGTFICIQTLSVFMSPIISKAFGILVMQRYCKWKESVKRYFFCYISFSKFFFLLYCFQGAKSFLNCVFQKHYTLYENLSLISGFSVWWSLCISLTCSSIDMYNHVIVWILFMVLVLWSLSILAS